MRTIDLPIERVPAHMLASCFFCGEPLDIRASAVHQWISGWAKNRAEGGTHGVSLPERLNRWAHGHCVNNPQKGKPLF